MKTLKFGKQLEANETLKNVSLISVGFLSGNIRYVPIIPDRFSLRFLIGSFFNENRNCPIWSIGNTECHQYPWHMFQPSRFEWEAPVIRGQLPFSRLFLKSSVLRWSWFYYQIYLNFFKSISLFTNSICKFWLPVTKLGACVVVGISFFLVSCRSVSTEGPIVLLLVKETPEMSLRINTACNF